MKRHLSILNTESSAMCGSCGGKCCKNLPGSTHPDEWGDNPQQIRNAIVEALLSGKWAVDCWDGDPRPGKSWDDDDALSCAMYVRPRRKGAPVWDKAWSDGRHPCILLTPTGCSLSHDARPSECRGLVPHPEGAMKCESSEEFDKRQNAIAWIPYQGIIDEALNLYQYDE